MPELPDVEGFRRVAAAHGTRQRVAGVSVPGPDMLRNTSPQGLGRALKRRRLAEPRRHGKWLILPSEDGHALLLHFGMTGTLVPADPDDERHPHDRLVLGLDNGELRYRNMRKFGGVWLSDDDADAIRAVTGDLGPDALGLDAARLRERLGDARGAVKAALMNQERIAGIGNLLADEVCWRAGIAPGRRVGSLGDEEWAALADALQETLAAAVPAGRVPGDEGWLTGVRGEDEARCPRCGATLRRARIAGRSTLWCPRDQS